MDLSTLNKDVMQGPLKHKSGLPANAMLYEDGPASRISAMVTDCLLPETALTSPNRNSETEGKRGHYVEMRMRWCQALVSAGIPEHDIEDQLSCHKKSKS